MDAWQSQFLALEMASPLHLGYRASGNLKQTRRYVPGRSIWGAIIERSARAIGAQHPQDFKNARSHVEETLRFSYGYASTEKDRVTTWPWDEPEYFDWQYMQSYAGTALADGHSKEDGSLHETEYISPLTREGKTVYILLCLWRREAASGKPYPDPLEEAFWAGGQIGGEKGYGWGRIRCAHAIPGGVEAFLGAAGWKTGETASAETIIVVAKASSQSPRVLAHVLPGPSPLVPAWLGRVEPVVGRETANHQPGIRLTDAIPAYEPGTRCPDSARRSFLLQQQAAWRPAS